MVSIRYTNERNEKLWMGLKCIFVSPVPTSRKVKALWGKVLKSLLWKRETLYVLWYTISTKCRWKCFFVIYTVMATLKRQGNFSCQNCYVCGTVRMVSKTFDFYQTKLLVVCDWTFIRILCFSSTFFFNISSLFENYWNSVCFGSCSR